MDGYATHDGVKPAGDASFGDRGLVWAFGGGAALRRGGGLVGSQAVQAFCAARLDGDWGQAYGTMPGALAAGAIIERARVTV